MNWMNASWVKERASERANRGRLSQAGCDACSVRNQSHLADGLHVGAAIDAAAKAINGSRRILDVVRRSRLREVSILILGGSMTLGHDAECPRACFTSNECPCGWPKQLSRVLSAGGARVRITTKAVGGTSSKWALHNAATWAGSSEPYDLVIIDYVVNDAGAYEWNVYNSTVDFLATSEALVRQVLSMPQAPALLMLHTVPAALRSCNWDLLRWQRPLLDYYGVPVLSFAHAILPSLNVSSGTSAARLERFWGRCPGTFHVDKGVHFTVAQLVASFWWHLTTVSWLRAPLAPLAYSSPALLPPALHGGSAPMCADRPSVSFSAQEASQQAGMSGAGARDAAGTHVPLMGGAWRLGEEELGKPGWILPAAALGSATRGSSWTGKDDALRFLMAFSSTPTLVITALTSYSNMGEYQVCLRLASCRGDKGGAEGHVQCRSVCSEPYSTQWSYNGSLFTSRVLRRTEDLPRSVWGMPARREGLSATNIFGPSLSPGAEYEVSLLRGAHSQGKLKITAVASC